MLIDEKTGKLVVKYKTQEAEAERKGYFHEWGWLHGVGTMGVIMSTDGQMTMVPVQGVRFIM